MQSFLSSIALKLSEWAIARAESSTNRWEKQALRDRSKFWSDVELLISGLITWEHFWELRRLQTGKG